MRTFYMKPFFQWHFVKRLQTLTLLCSFLTKLEQHRASEAGNESDHTSALQAKLV